MRLFYNSHIEGSPPPKPYFLQCYHLLLSKIALSSRFKWPFFNQPCWILLYHCHETSKQKGLFSCNIKPSKPININHYSFIHHIQHIVLYIRVKHLPVGTTSQHRVLINSMCPPISKKKLYNLKEKTILDTTMWGPSKTLFFFFLLAFSIVPSAYFEHLLLGGLMWSDELSLFFFQLHVLRITTSQIYWSRID